MEEFSVEDLEVARILTKLPWLMWDADHRLPSTHNLQWGTRKRRSTLKDDTPFPASAPAPPPPPPPPLSHSSAPPSAAEKFRKERGRAADVLTAKPSVEVTTAAGAGAPAKTPPSLSRPAASRKAAEPEANQGHQEKQAPDTAPVTETPEKSAAAPETSSPQTPLDFCASAEEHPDAKARGRPPSKNPRLKHEELSKQIDQLRSIGTELQKDVVEARARREALMERNSELKVLRIKLKEAAEHHHQQQQQQQQQEIDHHLHHGSCLDLLPMGPVLPIAAALAQQQQQYQQGWPQHWLSKPIFVHQLAPGFSVRPSAAVGQHWNWTAAAAAHTWTLDADKGSSHTTTQVPDRNCSAIKDSELESPPQRGNHCYCLQQPQQQVEQRKSSPEEQRAARKRRIETIQKRRNTAVAATATATAAASSGFSFR